MRYCGTLRGVDTPEETFELARMAGRPRRRTGLIAGVAVGAVVLVGATVAITIAATRPTATTPVAQQQTTTPAATTPAAATAATSAAAPATAGPALLKFGAKADAEFVTAIAYAYKQPVATKAPKPDQDGYEWGAADVEICAKTDGRLNNLSWVLVYADHSRIEASSIGYQQFPEPEYPYRETEMAPGQCVRGWITYPVPVGKRPTAVHYQPEGFQADWQVS